MLSFDNKSLCCDKPITGRNRHKTSITMLALIAVEMFIKDLKLIIYADLTAVEKIPAGISKSFLYICCDYGSVQEYLNRIIGNQVRILDSTRCCNLCKVFRHTLPLSRQIRDGKAA